MNIISPHFWQRVAILGFALLFHFNLAHAETAYLVSHDQTNLYLFDTTTNKLVSTIPLEGVGLSIAINPSGTRAYISHDGASLSLNDTRNGISVIDINGNSLLSKIQGYYEGGVVMNSQGTRLYAAGNGLNVIDTSTNSIIKFIDMSNAGSFSAAQLAINSTGTRLYAPLCFGVPSSSMYDRTNIGVVDIVNNTLLTSIVTGDFDNCPLSNALSPDNTRLYVADNNGFISVFNTDTNAKIAKIPAGSVFGIRINKQGTKVYVGGATTISVINTATNTVSNTISTNASANLAFNASGNRLYAVGGDTVSIIDPATDTVLSSTTIGTNLGLIDIGLAPVSILSVQKAGSGTGAITGNEMNCGATCTRGYVDNTNVTLTATADAGSTFTGWSGDCSGTTSSVSITMNQAKNCTATFEKLYRVTITQIGTGSGKPVSSPSLTWNGNIGTADIVKGQKIAVEVKLVFVSQGSVFTEWSGDCIGNLKSATWCLLTVDSPKNATIRFDENRLSIEKSGDGSGAVSSPTAGINSTTLNCGASCSTVFAAGTSVSLTATPNADSYFGGWNDPSCNTAITMNAPKTCIATFLKKPVLTVNKIGNGIVKGIDVDCGADCSESYSTKTATVALTATADAGFIFGGWSGNCLGNSNSCTLIMNSDKTAIANFTACTYALSSSSANIPAKTPNGSFVATSNCALETAKSDASWLTIVSQTNGTINYTVSTNLSTSERTGNITLNGQTFKVVQAANKPPIANFTATPNSGNAPLTVKVDASSSNDPEESDLEYQWTAPYNTQNAVGKTAQFLFDKEGNYTITLTVKDNTGQTHSQTQNVTVIPPECTSYGLNSTVSPLLKAAGDTNSFAITSNKGNCPLSAGADQNWVTTVSSPAKTDANGNATISYTIAPNPNTVEREAKVTVNNQPFVVKQEGLNCTYALSATVANHGYNAESGSVNVITPAASCNWTAKSNVDWITISSQSNGVVAYSIAANPTTQNRTGTLTIGGQTFTLNQAALNCIYSLSATNKAHTYNAETNSINVTAPTGCNWIVQNNNSWINLMAGQSGSGNGVITYNVPANTIARSRSGILGIANQTFTLSQEAVPCSYKLGLSAMTYSSATTNASVDLTAPEGCTWQATSNVAWITLVNNSGSGNGKVAYVISANDSLDPREGKITLVDQIFIIKQDIGNNQPPIARLTTIPATPVKNVNSITVNLDGRSSTDPENQPLQYDWLASDGQKATGGTATFTFDKEGFYFITLTVADSKGLTSVIKTEQITVIPPSTPIAQFTATPKLGEIPLQVNLDASKSYDPDGGDLVSYEWIVERKDAQIKLTAQGKETSFRFDQEGIYSITLKVTDNEGKADETSQTINAGISKLSFNAYRCATSSLNGFEGCQINSEEKPYYTKGSKLKVALDSQTVTNRFERLDLWVAIQLPRNELFNGEFLFRIPSQQFASPSFKLYQPPQYNGEAFMPDVEFANREDNVLEFDVPPHFSGKYTFYALYVALGKNPLLDSSSWRSDLVIKEITLE